LFLSNCSLRYFLSDRYDQNLLKAQFTKFATAAECKGDDVLQCLREKDGEVIQEANLITVHPADYGTFVYGPVVDKTLIPNLPGVLLKAGKFHKDIDIIVGHNRFFPYLNTILTIATKEPCLLTRMFRLRQISGIGFDKLFQVRLHRNSWTKSCVTILIRRSLRVTKRTLNVSTNSSQVDSGKSY
jgi:hypothetical protein